MRFYQARLRDLLEFRHWLGFETDLVRIDSRFPFLRSYFTGHDPAYKKLIQLSSAALFLSNIAEQSRYTPAVISWFEAPFVFYLLQMQDRRGERRASEPANLPTLHSFIASFFFFFFCRNNCPADCVSLREREKSQYTPRSNAQLSFRYNVSTRVRMYSDEGEVCVKTSPQIRCEHAKRENARDGSRIRSEIQISRRNFFPISVCKRSLISIYGRLPFRGRRDCYIISIMFHMRRKRNTWVANPRRNAVASQTDLHLRGRYFARGLLMKALKI